ncbi:MAG: IS4 family transposase, partial [bacterium]|nr:IS4 family transposase [bacterium]
NRSVPSAFFLTDGKSGERPFASQILSPGQTGIMDRGCQCHAVFDLLQNEGKNFVCRIKANTKKTVISENTVIPDSIVFYDAVVLLGTPGVNQTEEKVRLVGYRIDNAVYWVATSRFDLSAEQIAAVYKLRWDIEKFFAWWKRHLKVYHIIARSRYGLTVQIVAGLITYLLMAVYFRIRHNEKVSIKRVRQMRAEIRNENRNRLSEKNKCPDILILLL